MAAGTLGVRARGVPPCLEIVVRQRLRKIDLEWLRAGAFHALQACWKLSSERRGNLADLGEVCVTLVGDRKIAELHRRFMGIAGATDVITFQHGEVVVSVQTAERVAGERGAGFHGELLLYVVHGFLHLAGWDDVTPELREQMHRVQDEVTDAALEAAGRGPFFD